MIWSWQHASRRRVVFLALVATLSLAYPKTARADGPVEGQSILRGDWELSQSTAQPDQDPGSNAALDSEASTPWVLPPLAGPQTTRTATTVLLFGALSMAPAAVLMLTAFVRIQVVLMLLRQALGSPQVPGNQVVTALSLLLTVLVMEPHAERTYREGIEPYSRGAISATEAWRAGTEPIKGFMVDQILDSGHGHYLLELHDYATQGAARPSDYRQLPLQVVAPAFLISELTTALLMGFFLFLPFLIIDLVTSAILAAMGLFMLPPTLVTTPLKLVVFALAEGWWLVSGMLLRSFEIGGMTG